MCMKRSCKGCGKPTWAGCGMHIESALSGVPASERCPNWKFGVSKPCGEAGGAKTEMKGGFFGIGGSK